MADSAPQSASGIGEKVQREKADVLRPSAVLYLQLTALFIILTVIVSYHYVTRGFHRRPVETPARVPVADPEQGRVKIREYGCVGCHIVPGIPGADGTVGPPLDRVAGQAYVAGVLPTSPQNLAVWIRQPQDIDPRTAMPNLGVTEEDARDIAAYLYTLRDR